MRKDRGISREEEPVLLLDKGKQGIFHLIFGRTGVVILLLLVQLGLYLAAFMRLQELYYGPAILLFLVVALVIVLTQLINHTKIGMAMRAVAKDFETSQLMGIKINSVISATFVIGSALAAVGSMLYFTTYPAIVPTSGAMPGLKAFVAAVFGGIGSIPGAVIGAFLIGICENFVKILPFEGATTFVDAFTFALLIIVLVFKPTGLFGEKATDKV